MRSSSERLVFIEFPLCVTGTVCVRRCVCQALCVSDAVCVRRWVWKALCVTGAVCGRHSAHQRTVGYEVTQEANMWLQCLHGIKSLLYY